MKIYLKPIQFANLKDEITLTIESNRKVLDMFEEVNKIIPSFGNLEFMFRGKKLSLDKTLDEQGIKEGTKLVADYSHLSILKEDKLKGMQSIKAVVESLNQAVAGGILDAKTATTILANELGI